MHKIPIKVAEVKLGRGAEAFFAASRESEGISGYRARFCNLASLGKVKLTHDGDG